MNLWSFEIYPAHRPLPHIVLKPHKTVLDRTLSQLPAPNQNRVATKSATF